MNLRAWAAGGLVLFAVATLGPLVLQHNRVVSLRREISLLARELGTRQARQTAPPAATVPAVVSQPLTAAESLERLKLRAEYTRLKRENTDLAEYERENLRLAGQVKALGGATLRSDSQPNRSFIPIKEARMLGTSGPEEAFQSFVYALVHKDTNALGQVTAPSMYTSLIADSEVFEKANIPEGFQVRKIARGEDHAELEVVLRVKGQESTESLSLELVDGNWRMK